MNPEVHKIYIEDYQEGMPKRIHRDPNKPYVFQRIEDLLDDQSKSDSALGSVRARARAIIMDTRGVHRDVGEVKIIIGPKFDMLVKLDDDPDEPIFNEELVEDPSGSPRTPCASQCRFRRKIEDSYSILEVVTISSLRGKPRG